MTDFKKEALQIEGSTTATRLADIIDAEGFKRGRDSMREECANIAEDKFRDGYSAWDTIQFIRQIKA